MRSLTKIMTTSYHFYHCPLDGKKLQEEALGFLSCPKCETVYLPTLSKDGEASLSWRFKKASIAQGIEHLTSNERVAGSNPAGGSRCQ